MGTLPTEMIDKLERMTEQVVTGVGCKLYDVEFHSSGGGRILRVYIDKDVEGGPTVDDCANVSRGLNALLDEDDIIPGGKYDLEVSTPGIERPLKKPWHYQAAAGKKIWLKLDRSLQALGLKSQKFAAHKQLEEVVQGGSDQGVSLKVDNEDILIPYGAIERAHVVFEFGANKGKKKK